VIIDALSLLPKMSEQDAHAAALRLRRAMARAARDAAIEEATEGLPRAERRRLSRLMRKGVVPFRGTP